MKKNILIILFLFVLLVFTALARDVMLPTISQAISTAGYVAVRLPANYGADGYAIWTEDGSDYYLASESDGSDGILVPEGLGLSFVRKISKTASGSVVGYAKGTATTNLVGIIYSR